MFNHFVIFHQVCKWYMILNIISCLLYVCMSQYDRKSSWFLYCVFNWGWNDLVFITQQGYGEMCSRSPLSNTVRTSGWSVNQKMSSESLESLKDNAFYWRSIQMHICSPFCWCRTIHKPHLYSLSPVSNLHLYKKKART